MTRRSAGARTQHAPLRRIPWHELHDDQQALDQVWSGLPVENVTREDVRRFLLSEGLTAAESGVDTVYAYADGPRVIGSPVQSEWYLEFRFGGERLAEVAVEKRLLGP